MHLPVVSNEQCQDFLGSRIAIKDTHICAGHEAGELDGCSADSGGGLITVKSGHMILSGVMMGGVGCGRPKLPGVYTRVQKYVKWIVDIVSNNESTRRKRSSLNSANSSSNLLEAEATTLQVHHYIQAKSNTN